MSTLLVDPWALSFKDGEDPDEYVQLLLNLYDASLENAIDVQISARAAELLENDGAYPLSGELPTAAWPMRADIYRIVAGLLDRVPKIEDQQISAVLAENFAIKGVDIQASSVGHEEYLFDLLTLSMVRSRYYKLEAPVLSRVSVESLDVLFEANVLVVDSHDCDPGPVCGFYSSTVHLNTLVEDFYSALLPIDLATRGFVQKAISLEVWQRTRPPGCLALEAIGWSLGGSFIGNLTGCNVTANPGRMCAVIRASASVIAGINLRNTHALRSGKGAKCTQLSRKLDSAKGWRADIDDELHLHYWKVGNTVQLANVVFHNNFHIDE